MLAFHLLTPTALLLFFWRGRMTGRFTINDLPVFTFPLVLHLSEVVFTVFDGFSEILWIVLLASAVQTGLLIRALVFYHKPAVI